MQGLLSFLRVLTIVLASTGIGMALVIVWQYYRHPTGRLLPVHVALVAISWSLLEMNVVWQATASLETGLSVNLVFGAPASAIGTAALFVVLKYRQVARKVEELDVYSGDVLDARVRILLERASRDR